MSALAQEFNISVTPLGAQDEYLVRTEWVASGVPLAEEQVRWPVEDWLAQAKQLMYNPLLGVLQGNSLLDYTPTTASPDLGVLGQKLYDALFQKSLLNSWERAQGIAENRQMVLRLRLGLKGDRLPRLPWEVLHAGDRPLATGTDVAFSRYELTTGLRSHPMVLNNPNQPLKILMAIAGPSDQETLALKQEVSHLQQELRNRSYNGMPPIQLKILEQPGREQLAQALEQGRYQIFHYAGHSNLGAAGGDLYLVSGKTGLTETLSGDDLAGLLVNNGVQMAVFNSCRSAYTASEAISNNGREQNLVQALVKRRIPGVLAMAERIPDEVALTLTRLFYRNLNQGYPVDLSLSRARQGLISAYGSNQLYWALPVLYLDPKFDGFLTGSHEAGEIEKRLTLPDPSEMLTDGEEDALYATPAGVSAYDRISDYEDDLGMPLPEEWIEHDEEEMAGIFGDLDNGADYEDDLAVVSELFSQLPSSVTSDKPAVQTSAGRVLLPNSVEAEQRSSLQSSLSESKAKTQQQTAIQTSAIATQTLEANKQELKSAKKIAKSNFPGFWQGRFRDVPHVWMLFGATGAIAIACLGWWFFQNRFGPNAYLPPPIPTETVITPKNIDLKKADTDAVTSVAIRNFTQGDITNGILAAEELLKPGRNAIAQAEAALAAVPRPQQDNPTILFLKGRLAWQYVQTWKSKSSSDNSQTEKPLYSVDDVQRYWERAIQKQPNSPQYRNALGFAYYSQGKFDLAYNAWVEALKLIPQNPAAIKGSDAQKQSLTANAGLALFSIKQQSAQNQPNDKRVKLLNLAIQYRQQVMATDPVNFQPEALSKNWMWTEKAIQDWRSLLSKSA